MNIDITTKNIFALPLRAWHGSPDFKARFLENHKTYQGFMKNKTRIGINPVSIGLTPWMALQLSHMTQANTSKEVGWLEKLLKAVPVGF